jgi:cytochrome c553
MNTGFSKSWRVLALAVLTIVIWLGPIKHANAAETGRAIFEDQCAACHSIGKGKLVGPDLAGVTLRREEGWLIRQIKDPERMIEEEDPIALQLLKESDDVPMATLELSDEDVAAVIAYLKSVENQASVATSLPSQYVPTVLLSVVVLAGLTLIGLRVGNKKVDVR